MKKFTLSEVARHNKDGDNYIVIDEKVYDVSSFSNFHPGGVFPLRSVAGKDATEDFYALHRASVLSNPRFKSLQIGTVEKKKGEKQSGDTPYGEASGFWRVHSPYYKPHHHRYVLYFHRLSIHPHIHAPTNLDFDKR